MSPDGTELHDHTQRMSSLLGECVAPVPGIDVDDDAPLVEVFG